MRSWIDESLLRRPPQEDSRRYRTRNVQSPGRPLFDVSLSSVKRYSRIVRQGDSYTPKKGTGRPPKIHETAKKLLEEDIKERPAATAAERRRFLEHLTGKPLSKTTVRRLLKRLGFSRKKGLWGGGERLVLEGRLAGDGCWATRAAAASIRG